MDTPLFEGGVVQAEAEAVQDAQHTLGGRRGQQADAHGVEQVEREADGDGFAVGDGEIGHLFQLVRRPVTEVQRTG